MPMADDARTVTRAVNPLIECVATTIGREADVIPVDAPTQEHRSGGRHGIHRTMTMTMNVCWFGLGKGKRDGER